jgi:thiamine biosynthesis lipoprotein ApbE
VTDQSDSNSIASVDNQSAIIHSSYVNNRRQPFFNVSHVSLTRSPHQESYAKMQQEDEEEEEEEELDKSSISFISDKRTSHHQQQSKMYNIDEDLHISDNNHNNISSHINRVNNDDGEEMILTPTKLTSFIMPSSNISSTTNNSRC